MRIQKIHLENLLQLSHFLHLLLIQHYVFSMSMFFKLTFALTTSLPLSSFFPSFLSSSSLSFCAKDNWLNDKNNILPPIKEIIITKYRIWIGLIFSILLK